MQSDLVEKVRNNPQYQELVAKRSVFAWTLAIIMLAAYYAYILVVAFAPASLGQTLSGGTTTIGIPIGVAIIVFSFILTGIYVWRANTEFDELTRQVKEAVK